MMCAPTTMYGYPIVDGVHPWQLHYLSASQCAAPVTFGSELSRVRTINHKPHLNLPQGEKIFVTIYKTQQDGTPAPCEGPEDGPPANSRPLWMEGDGLQPSTMSPYIYK